MNLLANSYRPLKSEIALQPIKYGTAVGCGRPNRLVRLGFESLGSIFAP